MEVIHLGLIAEGAVGEARSPAGGEGHLEWTHGFQSFPRPRLQDSPDGGPSPDRLYL
jgi:hypothetical protein